MASRVVRPETVKWDISDGDWLILKKRLTHGEQQQAFARKYVADAFGQRLNLRLVGMDKVLAYLMDWSLVGLDGKQIVIRGQKDDVVEAALNSIDPDSFAEIRDAITAHEAKEAAARAEEKKAQAGASGSSATSPSLELVASRTSGSVA